MTDPSLIHGKFIRRYKRFLVDVRLDNGEQITAHCPNTGSMKNCLEPEADVWLSKSNNPKRKYAHTWELIRLSHRYYVGVNTGSANTLVKEAIQDDKIPELKGYSRLQTEQKYGQENSRIDILLSGHASRTDCYVEVKSVTLLEKPMARGIGYFPDSVSERGSKHLRELSQSVQQGYRAVLVFCVQHTGIREVRPAAHIDEKYAQTLTMAIDAGVEVLAYKTSYRGNKPRLVKSIPVVI